MTSGSKHTPGPWQVEIPHNGYVQVIGGIDGDSYDDGSSRVIYTHVCDVIDNDDEQLNARLIAAAPDLLEALEQLVEGVQISEDVTGIAVAYLVDARNAIAKAKGK